MNETQYISDFLAPRDAWDKLSIEEQAAMMKTAVSEGILDLGTIRQKYNEFAEGGNTDDDLVDWIIREEGFIANPRDIGDGKMTLGSGLTAQKWHDQYKRNGNKWTSSDNRKAVREEVANRRRWAERNIPNWDSLPSSSQKALLSYKYNYDFNRTNSPKLFKALSDSNLQEAARQMDATSSNPIFKKGLQDRRQREQEWFLKDVASSQVPDTFYQPAVSTQVYNPYIQQVEATRMLPIDEPDPNSYIRTREVSPQEQRRRKFQENVEAYQRFNALMDMIDLRNNPAPSYNPIYSLFGDNTEDFAKGGKIHINPSKKGTFTAAASKHGMGVQQFASRVLAHPENYSPAMRKKANFAKNARKWKHGLGGNLFDGNSQPTQKMQLGSAYWQQQKLKPIFTEELTEFGRRKKEEDKQRRVKFQKWAETKGREITEKRARDYTTTSNDNTWIEKNNGRTKNSHLNDRAIEGAKQWATNDKAFREEHPVLATVGDIAQIAPFALATAPITVPVGDVLAGTALGQLATRALTHPIAEAIGTSITGGHGLSDLISGNANEFTALELAPLAFPYGNFAKGASEAINYAGNKVPASIKDAWNNRAEKLAKTFGTEGKTWAKVTDPKGKEGIVFLNNNTTLKGLADWSLHPVQTYRNWSQGFYPMTRKGWKSYLSKERDAMDFAKQKSIELNDAQLQQRLSLQPETFLDNKQRNTNATIKIIDDPNNIFSWPRAPRNASEVANNVKVISRDKDVSYGGRWFDSKFGTGTAAVSHPDKNVIVLPRHDQTKFSNMLMTMPSRGYTSPIDTRMHTYVHELQHQMQQNLPLLNLSQWDDATQYYVPYDHFLKNIGSENLLQPFKDTVGDPKRYWYASPNEYNAESNAYRVVDDFNGRRDILDPLDNTNAHRASIFGLDFNQTNSLWNMGYKNGGYLKKRV